MKNFIRSLKYLKPYRLRISMAVLCVIFIAALWSGSMGLMLPGAKIMVSEEGLHGWAYMTLISDRLGAKIGQQKTPIGTTLEGDGGQKIELESVINISRVEKASPAQAAGLAPADWIIGVQDGDPNHLRMRDDALIRMLGRMNEGQRIALRVLRQGKQPPVDVTVTLGPAKYMTRALSLAAAAIPDPGSDFSGRFQMFTGLLVMVLVVTVIRSILMFFQEYLVGTAIWQGIMDMRSENYNVVLHLPTTFFSANGVTDATSRFVQDTNELARGQNTLLGKTMVEPAKALGLLVLAMGLSWKLTLAAMLAGPPAYWFIRGFGKKMHKASKRALESWSTLLAVLNETLQGIRVVKAYTMEGSERRRFFRVNRELLKQQNKMERLDAATGPTMETLGIAAGMVAAGVAGYWVFVGFNTPDGVDKMDRDIFLAWIVALFALFDPVRKLVKVSMRFQASDAAAARIFELQDATVEPIATNAFTLPRHSQDIEFRNVSFRYPNAASDALKDINLTLKAGQTLAIVGPNGSGKTTLVSLLPRLIDPTAGQVFVDGKDISQCSVRSLRRQIGLVTQDTVLFHATLRENISYGLRRPHPGEVLAAAKKAFVDDFVRDLPAGYETMVGEYGATLSGGQKQRITIARAILRNPAILIFDEAMSQVDSDSERRIHQAMEEFTKGRTTLLIAHRFATVLSADQIAVMNDGRIIDLGTHAELVARCELYQHLYRTQFIDSGGK